MPHFRPILPIDMDYIEMKPDVCYSFAAISRCSFQQNAMQFGFFDFFLKYVQKIADHY